MSNVGMSLRSLAKHPLYSALSIATLALGIGTLPPPHCYSSHLICANIGNKAFLGQATTSHSRLLSAPSARVGVARHLVTVVGRMTISSPTRTRSSVVTQLVIDC